MSRTAINRIILLLKLVYKGPAWPGPSIMDVLKEITIKEALLKRPNSNNIAELVHHITAWRVFAIKRLQGETTFEVEDDFNFVAYTNIDQTTWDGLLQRLAESQQTLLTLLKKYDDDKLKEKVSGKPYDFYVLLQGVIQHDYYHLGQIVLLRKEMGG